MPPQGLIIRSGKANGFIAGADVDEFGDVDDEAEARWRSCAAAGTRSSGSRDVAYPTLALIKGFCLGGGLELALACRYRVVVDEPGTRLGLPEVMLGIVPGWGGIKRLPRLVGAPAALDLLLTGKTIDARRAKKLGLADECVPVRIMENTARGVLRALPPPRTLPFPAVADAASAGAAIHRGAGGEAGGEARAARALSGAVRDPRAVRAATTATRSRVPAGDPASIPSLLATPTAANLIRVFRLQERLKALGKDGDVQGGARARRRRRHDGRRHRRVVRAARPDRDAAGPERGAAGARDEARGEAVRRAPEGSAPRARRDATG